MLYLLETKCSVWFALCCVAHICMTDMTSLISFLLILFHYWAAFVVYQQNQVNNTSSNSLVNIFSVNHIQDGSFWGCSRIGVEICPLPKTCRKYPIMMKLKHSYTLPNIYISRDTLIKFCWHQYFFTKNYQLLLYQDMKI